ncbi:MAG: M13 family metallopeptidase N-terminal domain-containing protein, partial [Acidobacteriota bacterium]
MNFLRAALTAILCSLALVAQTPGPAVAPDPLKVTPGFDLGAIDRKANPCDDFYQFACGTWLKNNPIPSDHATWGRFSELDERNRAILRQILDQAAEAKTADANTKKIGDYYASCMDEKAIDAKGADPLKPELDRIAGMRNTEDLSTEVARLHRLGVNVLFNLSSGQDARDSTAVIGQMDQGGLGLPERDYYFRDDPKAVETRKEYVAFLTRMLGLLGVPAADAQTRAEAVMQLETALAKASLDVTARRDPEKTYHKMKLAEFEALSDSFRWSRYFAIMQAPPMESLNVAVPDFFKGQEALLKATPIDVWKSYLTLRLVSGQAMLLPAPFDKENFAFFGKFLTGAKEQRPRWKRCVAATDGDLGEALGIAYVARTFGAEGKQRTLDMVGKLEAALGRDLQQLSWMTPQTKQKAIEKLHAITNKIGYPDKWRDYSALTIVRGDAMGNSLRA